MGFTTMDLADDSHKLRWSIVSLLFAASLINYLDRAAISFALPFISKDFHLTPQGKGLLLSSFFWSYSLMQIPIGWCADRFNLYWLYAGMFALWCVAQGLTGLARSLARYGWRQTFLILGFGALLWLIPWLFVFPSRLRADMGASQAKPAGVRE